MLPVGRLSRRRSMPYIPCSVAQVMQAADVTSAGAVRWGDRPSPDEPGVYAVAMTDSPHEIVSSTAAPISPEAVQHLLEIRSELQLDGARPRCDQLVERLASMWLADETILYMGLASTSVAKRVVQYYRTPLGARSPHAGGWPLKTLTNLDRLWVHYAPCGDVDQSERAMLDAFVAQVSGRTKTAVCDPLLPLPFANLTVPRGRSKRHGISGARQPRRTPSSTHPPLSGAPARSANGPSAFLTQCVTDADLAAGRIRIPVASKPALPPTKQYVTIVLRGQRMEVRWDPRTEPRSRSGVLGIGRAQVSA